MLYTIQILERYTLLLKKSTIPHFINIGALRIRTVLWVTLMCDRVCSTLWFGCSWLLHMTVMILKLRVWKPITSPQQRPLIWHNTKDTASGYFHYLWKLWFTEYVIDHMPIKHSQYPEWCIKDASSFQTTVTKTRAVTTSDFHDTPKEFTITILSRYL